MQHRAGVYLGWSRGSTRGGTMKMVTAWGGGNDDDDHASAGIALFILQPILNSSSLHYGSVIGSIKYRSFNTLERQNFRPDSPPLPRV